MRLINVHTRALEEFFDADIPPYAILSHTWSKDEVSLAKYQTTTFNVDEGIYESSLRGFRKIEVACRCTIDFPVDENKGRALWTISCWDTLSQNSLDSDSGAASSPSSKAVLESSLPIQSLCHLWVDTCCIDKTSSAELSEAINSMYRWYKRSVVCFVYLEDVELDHKGSNLDAPWDDPAIQLRVGESRWLRRGWTLQEMIAPRELIFFDKRWTSLGARVFWAQVLAARTGVPAVVLEGSKMPSEYCIAQRMSWASYRETTRREDMAYCLLGIFDVNMPLLYGEGWRAFKRLQEEIIKGSIDQTILLWQNPPGRSRTTVLADMPSQFIQDSGIYEIDQGSGNHSGYVLNNAGLQINVELHETYFPGYHLVKLMAGLDVDLKMPAFRDYFDARLIDNLLAVMLAGRRNGHVYLWVQNLAGSQWETSSAYRVASPEFLRYRRDISSLCLRNRTETISIIRTSRVYAPRYWIHIIGQPAIEVRLVDSVAHTHSLDVSPKEINVRLPSSSPSYSGIIFSVKPSAPETRSAVMLIFGTSTPGRGSLSMFDIFRFDRDCDPEDERYMFVMKAYELFNKAIEPAQAKSQTSDQPRSASVKLQVDGKSITVSHVPQYDIYREYLELDIQGDCTGLKGQPTPLRISSPVIGGMD